MIKAIIFDFFGVIRSDTGLEWLNKNGYVLEGELLEITKRLDLDEIAMDEFVQTFSRITGKLLTIDILEQNAQVYYDVLEIINELRKKYKVAILSNAPSAFFREVLKNNDLEKYFDEIVVSGEVKQIKPHPEIFEIMLKKLGIKASEAIFVDDKKGNITAAERLGMKGIQFSDSEQLKKELLSMDILTS